MDYLAQRKSRWDDKVREGLVIHYHQSMEPARSGTFLSRIFKFTALFSDGDRDVPIHNYVLREIGERGRQCTVRMCGYHRGAQPQQSDFVSFVGQTSRQNIFVSSRGRIKRTGEQILVHLPKWAR